MKKGRNEINIPHNCTSEYFEMDSPSYSQLNIGKARRVLTEDATKRVMQSLVMSRLDYFNALLIGIQHDLIAKLQRLQNSAARIVSRTGKYEHITPVLIKLHWLPIKFRIQFKVLLLVYKALVYVCLLAVIGLLQNHSCTKYMKIEK